MNDDIHPDSQDDSPLAYTAGAGDREPDLAREILSAIERCAQDVAEQCVAIPLVDPISGEIFLHQTSAFSSPEQCAIAFVRRLNDSLTTLGARANQPAITALACQLESLLTNR